MLVEIQKWGNSAALRLPAAALKEAGFQVGQKLDLKLEKGKLSLEPVAESLDDLLARITPENCHGPLLEGPAKGEEIW